MKAKKSCSNCAYGPGKEGYCNCPLPDSERHLNCGVLDADRCHCYLTPREQAMQKAAPRMLEVLEDCKSILGKVVDEDWDHYHGTFDDVKEVIALVESTRSQRTLDPLISKCFVSKEEGRGNFCVGKIDKCKECGFFRSEPDAK
jgi:hypothetical protein